MGNVFLLCVLYHGIYVSVFLTPPFWEGYLCSFILPSAQHKLKICWLILEIYAKYERINTKHQPYHWLGVWNSSLQYNHNFEPAQRLIGSQMNERTFSSSPWIEKKLYTYKQMEVKHVSSCEPLLQRECTFVHKRQTRQHQAVRCFLLLIVNQSEASLSLTDQSEDILM